MGRMGKISIQIVFNEGNFALGQELDQLPLLDVRHATPERVAEVQGENAGFNAAGLQPFSEFIQTDPFPGKRRNLAGLHAERLDDLQNAVVGRRLDRDGVAGLRHSAQA